ncbi:hypothetical protein SEVIR_5G159208v4 [Setaria viridis]
MTPSHNHRRRPATPLVGERGTRRAPPAAAAGGTWGRTPGRCSGSLPSSSSTPASDNSSNNSRCNRGRRHRHISTFDRISGRSCSRIRLRAQPRLLPSLRYSLLRQHSAAAASCLRGTHRVN